jgi:hypothetical protein
MRKRAAAGIPFRRPNVSGAGKRHTDDPIEDTRLLRVVLSGHPRLLDK